MAHDAMVRQDEDGRLAILHVSDPGCLGSYTTSHLELLEIIIGKSYDIYLVVIDPASMVEPLLAASQYTSRKEFSISAQRQIDFLIIGKAPRTPDGILSHRMDKLQFWVDGIYMVVLYSNFQVPQSFEP